MKRPWDVIGAVVRRAPRGVLLAALAVTVALAVGLPFLHFDTSQDALIGGSSRVGRENHRYQAQFGGEPMLVAWTGPVERLFTAHNIEQMAALDRALRASGLFKDVLSPVTAMQFARDQLPLGPQILGAAQAARPYDAARYQSILTTELGRLGQVTGPQQLDNPSFVRYLLYDEHGKIRPALADNFVDRRHALMIVRLRGNDPIGRMGRAADTVKRLVARYPLAGFTSLATGPPVLLQEINGYLRGGMTTLGGLALVVMVVVLSFVFRVRQRLLSLAMVAVSALATFGLMGYVGIPLNLVTISGLPILIGMGVDFAIQMHSRFEEEVDIDGQPGASVTRVMAHLAPALGIALIAAVLAFVALEVSKVPMIRQFGVMLMIGVAMIFLVVLFLPLAFLVLRERRRPTVPHQRVYGRGLERMVRALAFVGQRWVLPLVLVGVVIVVAGLSVEGRFTIQTDPEKWVPQHGATVRSLRQLRAATGFSTELDFFVEAPDVTSTGVASWMQTYAERQVRLHPDELVHVTSFGNVVTGITQTPPGQPEMLALLSVAPPDIKTAFISPDHRRASLIFPISNISLHQRERLLDAMKADLHPPAGVRATPSGLVVVGIALVDALQANRSLITFLALGLVALWLLFFYRRITPTVLTLVPVLVAVGLSSLLVFATALELSPLTSVSSPLVIAVGTEFAVLILTRYVEERENGRSREDAVERGIVRIGRAFVASGLTLVGGFAVIALSAFPLLRDFGIVVALNAVVALLVALIVLPPLLVWADRTPRLGGFSPGWEARATSEPDVVTGPEPAPERA